MFDKQKIKLLLAHRVQAVDALNLALRLRMEWQDAPPITIHINGKLTIEGNLNAITNPMLEVGLVHCRALLEFLGLCDKGGSLGQIKNRRSTDVGVENFCNVDGPLKKVDPQVALSRYGGERSEAERSLVKILHVTNKGLAHNTMSLIEDSEASKLFEIASRGVPALMVSYFYTPLGLPRPSSTMTRRRDASDQSQLPSASGATG